MAKIYVVKTSIGQLIKAFKREANAKHYARMLQEQNNKEYDDWMKEKAELYKPLLAALEENKDKAIIDELRAKLNKFYEEKEQPYTYTFPVVEVELS